MQNIKNRALHENDGYTCDTKWFPTGDTNIGFM